MERPENAYEAASYDLTKFRERRMHDRRAVARDSSDRRMSKAEQADKAAVATGQSVQTTPEAEPVAEK